jgi:hypothetical protein
MFRLIACFAIAALTFSAVAGVASRPRTVPHREIAAGALDELLPGSLTFSGRGVGSHFGRYSIEGGHDFDDMGRVLNGRFTTTTADGATISGSYSGSFEVLASGQAVFNVRVLWEEGTGRLAGVTGEGDVVAVLETVAPGGSLRYVTDATLTFP